MPEGGLERERPRRGRFHAEHRTLYGYDFAGDPSQQVEWVNLRVSGIGPIRGRRSGGLPAGSSTGEEFALNGHATTRPVCFDAEAGYVDTPVVPRADLAAGVDRGRPVIVEEFGSTVPIHPGFEVRLDGTST